MPVLLGDPVEGIQGATGDLPTQLLGNLFVLATQLQHLQSGCHAALVSECVGLFRPGDREEKMPA